MFSTVGSSVTHSVSHAVSSVVHAVMSPWSVVKVGELVVIPFGNAMVLIGVLSYVRDVDFGFCDVGWTVVGCAFRFYGCGDVCSCDF